MDGIRYDRLEWKRIPLSAVFGYIRHVARLKLALSSWWLQLIVVIFNSKKHYFNVDQVISIKNICLRFTAHENRIDEGKT